MVRRWRPLQFVQRDRQVAHALAGRVIDRIGDRRRDPDDADLADALDAERIDDRVRLVDEDHLDVVDVGVHRHVVFGEIGIHDPAELVVDQGFLVQRHADAHDHAAQDLAARGLGIEDAPGGNGADHARDPDDAELLVDLDLREYAPSACCGRISRLASGLFDACRSRRSTAAVPHRICDGHRKARVPLADNACRPPARRPAARHLRAGNPARSGRGATAPRATRRTWRRCALATEEAVHDPPSTGACGNVESPSFTLTFSIGSPSRSAGTCAMTV